MADEPQNSKFRVLAGVSTLLSRLGLAGRLGLQFGGKRDLYAVYGYKLNPDSTDFVLKYLRQDIAGRIVDAPAAAIWRNPPKVEGGDAFNTRWDVITKEHDVWSRLDRADKLCGLGAFSALFVGLSDSGDVAQPVRPQRSGNGSPREILYIQPFAENSLAIDKFEEDSTNPRFSLPLIYELRAVDPSGTAVSGLRTRAVRTQNIKVHHTRILHVAENLLEDDTIGNPRMARVYNLLEDMIKVSGGSAETYWLASNRGMQADIDKEMELGPTDATDLADEIEEYQHELRRFVRTRGVTLKALGDTVVDPRGVFDVLILLIAGATGIPRRILLGAEAGQLASEQDRANWADRISERQTGFAEPNVLRPFIRLLVNAEVLPEPIDLTIEWPSAFTLTPMEEAQRSAQMGRAATNLSKQTKEPQAITSREEAREMLGLPKEHEEGEVPLGSAEDPFAEEEETIDPTDPADLPEEVDDDEESSSDNVVPIADS